MWEWMIETIIEPTDLLGVHSLGDNIRHSLVVVYFNSFKLIWQYDCSLCPVSAINVAVSCNYKFCSQKYSAILLQSVHNIVYNIHCYMYMYVTEVYVNTH